MTTVTIDNGKILGYETAEEFANRIGVNESTIRVWVKRGKIETLKIGNIHFVKIGTEKPQRKKRK